MAIPAPHKCSYTRLLCEEDRAIIFHNGEASFKIFRRMYGEISSSSSKSTFLPSNPSRRLTKFSRRNKVVPDGIFTRKSISLSGAKLAPSAEPKTRIWEIPNSLVISRIFSRCFFKPSITLKPSNPKLFRLSGNNYTRSARLNQFINRSPQDREAGTACPLGHCPNLLDMASLVLPGMLRKHVERRFPPFIRNYRPFVIYFARILCQSAPPWRQSWLCQPLPRT